METDCGGNDEETISDQVLLTVKDVSVSAPTYYNIRVSFIYFIV